MGRDRRGRPDDRLQMVRLRQTAAAADREHARGVRRARRRSAPMSFSMLNVLPWIEWIAASRLGQAINTSTWAFAVIESVHLLALAVIGGAVLMVDLRLLGFGLRAQPLDRVARDAWPWFVGSWVVMIVTGVLLFVSEPLKLYYNTLFFWK